MRCIKKMMAFALSASMVLSGFTGMALNKTTASAAKKVTLKLSSSSISMTEGGTTVLKLTKKNVQKTKMVKWSSKNKKIATVNSKGTVTAVKAGKTTISVKVRYLASDAKKYKTAYRFCKVTVKAAQSKATAVPVADSQTAAPATVSTADPAAAPTTVSPTEVTAEPVATPKATPVITPEPTLPPNASTPDPNITARPETTTIPKKQAGKSKNGITMYDDGVMDETLSASQLIKNMGQGWNLGNTLESCGADQSAIDSYIADKGKMTPSFYETLWGQPETEQKMMTALKRSGFDTIRIPVAWSNMISDDGSYTIEEAWFNRIETVMNYCFSNNMYVVLNIHYDSGWWGMFGSADETVREEAWKKYEAIWTQIAERFQEYGDYLIFESANEELGTSVGGDNMGLNTAVDGNNGILTEDEAYEMTNEINQKFVDIVRESGGNNTYRQLLLAGFNTDLDKTCDDRWKLPTDPTEEKDGIKRMSVSIHYYSPSDYCIAEDKTSTTWYSASWGTQEDYDDLHTQMDKVKKFTDDGYGVIYGEYGPQAMDKQGIAAFIREVMLYSAQVGAAPILWNNSVFDRYDYVICYSDIAQVLQEVTGAANIPLEEGAIATGTASGEIIDNESNLTLVASWEGVWSRTNNKGITADGEPDTSKGEVGCFTTTSCSDGLTVQSNAFFWQLFFTYDKWDTLTNPCLRITMAEDETSQGADYQFAYCKGFDVGAAHLDTMDHETYNTKCVTLSAAKLAGAKSWIELSSPTEGAKITKIEIYDEQ